MILTALLSLATLLPTDSLFRDGKWWYCDQPDTDATRYFEPKKCPEERLRFIGSEIIDGSNRSRSGIVESRPSECGVRYAYMEWNLLGDKDNKRGWVSLDKKQMCFIHIKGENEKHLMCQETNFTYEGLYCNLHQIYYADIIKRKFK